MMQWGTAKAAPRSAATEVPSLMGDLPWRCRGLRTEQPDTARRRSCGNQRSDPGESRPCADLAARADEVRFGDRSVRVASLIDIIESKEWADRPKDRDALVELRTMRDDPSGTRPDDETSN